jgi:hypothetical protein
LEHHPDADTPYAFWLDTVKTRIPCHMAIGGEQAHHGKERLTLARARFPDHANTLTARD